MLHSGWACLQIEDEHPSFCHATYARSELMSICPILLMCMSPPLLLDPRIPVSLVGQQNAGVGPRSWLDSAMNRGQWLTSMCSQLQACPSLAARYVQTDNSVHLSSRWNILRKAHTGFIKWLQSLLPQILLLNAMKVFEPHAHAFLFVTFNQQPLISMVLVQFGYMQQFTGYFGSIIFDYKIAITANKTSSLILLRDHQSFQHPSPEADEIAFKSQQHIQASQVLDKKSKWQVLPYHNKAVHTEQIFTANSWQPTRSTDNANTVTSTGLGQCITSAAICFSSHPPHQE